MKAHEFVAEHGVEAIKQAIQESNAYGGDWIDTKTLEVKKYIPSGDSVFIGELKQVVESVEMVDSYKGITEAKAYMTRYFKLNGYFRKDYPKTGKFITQQMSFLEKAIADYELVESYKENQHV